MKTIGDIANEIVPVGENWESININRNDYAIVDEASISTLLTNTQDWFTGTRPRLSSSSHILRAVAAEPKSLKTDAAKELVSAIKNNNIPAFYPPDFHDCEPGSVKLKVKQDSEAGPSMWYTAESGVSFSLKADYIINGTRPEIHFVTEGDEKILAAYAKTMMEESGEDGDIYVNATRYSPRNGLKIETISDVVATISATGKAPVSIVKKR